MTSFEQTITDLQELRKIDYELGAKLENSKDSNEVLISLNRKQADDIKELEDNLVSDEVTFKWQAERIKELEASLSDSKVTNSSQKSHINKILGDLDDANQHRDQSLGALSNRDATIRQLKRDLSDKVSQLEGQRDTLLDCQTDYRKRIEELEADLQESYKKTYASNYNELRKSEVRIEELEAQSGTRYSIDLQRAIEAHCRGEIVPADTAKLCPHHSGLLNAKVGRIKDLETLLKIKKGELATYIRRDMEHCKLIDEERDTNGNLEARLDTQNAKLTQLYKFYDDGQDTIKELEATIGGLQVNVKGLGAMIKSQADFIGEQQQTIDEQRVDLRTLKGKLVEFGPIKSTNQQDNC